MIIDRNRKIPLYRQIYEDINRRVVEGEYMLGSMLPSENSLCAMYEVERSTVRKALAMMVEDGKIAKNPGLGSSIISSGKSSGSVIKQNLLFLLQKGNNNLDRIIEPFNAKLLEIMDQECSERGYTLLYKPFFDSVTVEELIQSCNPIGVFYTNSIPTEIYKGLIRKGIPVVMVNISHPMYPSVCLDNRGGAKMVVEYLYELGHRNIAFITGGQRGQIDLGRYTGYKDALDGCGIEYKEKLVVNGDWSIDSGKSALKQLYDRSNPPTAIFAANDSMAIGVILEASRLGITIPDDLSVVGFDNIDQSIYTNPSLTTVAVDYNTMARAACMLMLDMIEHDNCELNVNIYVPLTLLERESTRSIGRNYISSKQAKVRQESEVY